MVLAHQGGWDEMLFVAIPVALFAGLLWLANRRATAQLRRRQQALLAEQAQQAEHPDHSNPQHSERSKPPEQNEPPAPPAGHQPPATP